MNNENLMLSECDKIDSIIQKRPTNSEYQKIFDAGVITTIFGSLIGIGLCLYSVYKDKTTNV